MNSLFIVLTTALFVFIVWSPSLRSPRQRLLWLLLLIGVHLLWWQPRWLPTNNSAHTLTTIDPLLRQETMLHATTVISDDVTLNDNDWQALPARVVEWQPQSITPFDLHFAATTTVARLWQLHVTFAHTTPWQAQLLDESGSLLHSADSDAQGLAILQWIPAVAENVVFTLRLVNQQQQVLQEGPIAISVLPAMPFTVDMLIASPGFDAQFLRRGFEQSRLRWQITTQLGQGTQWQQRSDADALVADLLIVDARRFEAATHIERDAWTQHGKNEKTVLLVDFGGPKETAFWQKRWHLEFHQNTSTALAHWPLRLAEQLPVLNRFWQPVFYDSSRSAGLYQFEDKALYWLAVQGWHQAQISQPQAVYDFWQRIFDQIAVNQSVNSQWQTIDDLAFVHERQDRCIDSTVPPAITLNNTRPLPAVASTTTPHRYCTSFWPKQVGWHTLESYGTAWNFYVYDDNDWSLLKQNRNQKAATQFQKRPVVESANAAKSPLPDVVIVAVLLLVLLWTWKRELS